MISEFPANSTVLVLTYRQSLAYELAGSKLGKDGFVNYQDVQELHNRVLYPRVVIQVDSIDRLTPDRWSTPQFDYVIIDEIESLLLHLSAKTLKEPVRIINKLMLMLRGTPNGIKPQIITLDALWGASSYTFFKLNDISQRLIINEKPPQQPKRFILWACEFDEWIEEIGGKLRQGKNCILKTLSYNHGENVVRAIVQQNILRRDEIIFHHSKQSEQLRRGLRHVNTLWNTKRLVVFTNTVETVRCSCFVILFQRNKASP